MKRLLLASNKTIQSYFTRVSQIKEKLEAVDDEVENSEIVMTTLNGLPRTWDSFIQGICGRKKRFKFSRLWKECSQEEARIATREEKMGSEDQSLTVQSKKSKTNHHQGKHFNPKIPNRNLPKFRCYTCDERGHYARDCPKNKNS